MKAMAIPVCVIITLAGGCSSGGQNGTSGTLATTTTRASTRCHTPELEAIALDGGAASGHSIAYFQLKNISSRACQLFGVPLIGLRGISDGAADLRHVGDWTEYLHVIDEKLAAAIGLLEQAIGGGLLGG